MGLREVRQQQQLTQEQLADRSGVDQKNISAIETGKIRNPSWDTVARLARALSIPPEKLFPVFDLEGAADGDRRSGSDRRQAQGEGVV